MRKWIKRILLLFAFLLVCALAALYGGFRMLRSTPEWYRRYTATFAEREAAAQRAFNKFAGVQNAAADVRRKEIIARNAHNAAPVVPGEITVSFTDDELNAFFQKWSSYEDWKSNYEPYLEDPTVILHEGRIIFAAKAKILPLEPLASVHIEPKLDDQGRLMLNIADILGGRLSMPDAIVSPWENRVINGMRARLPGWQANAQISPDGSANGDLIAACFAKLLVHSLERAPADPVLFLPLVEHHSNVPVKVTGISVQEHVLTVKFQPLDSAARAALVDRIRAAE